ncbi:MAG: hypothetical protein K0U41_03470 [Gammaproteobacteria bacterium]|nr:hypothetical protein [Gammaproteobacteria bacterium]
MKDMKNIKSTAIIIATAVLLVACGGGGGGGSSAAGGGGNATTGGGGATSTPPTAVAVSPATTVTANTVAAYTNGITITTTVTDGDPDDGARPTLGYTTSPVGSCSVSDEVLGGFDGNGVATATAKVNLLSASTTCVVTVTPNEAVDGTHATFTIAQEHIAPLLAVPSDATGAEGTAVIFTVTATKQDAGATTAVVFAATFTGDDCTVTRMDPATAGGSGYTSVGNTYNQVYSTTRAGSGNCTIPKSSFTATEDGELGNGGTGDIFINFLPDSDGDGVEDNLDVDADGDGLIELHTAAQLDMVRNNLFGTGLDANNSDGDVNAGGNDMGCGNAVSITACNGYELVGDIDLAAAGYDNWDPTGSGTSPFSAIFEGNGFKIRNLKIQIDVVRDGWGFFGYIKDATIRNIHVRDVNITMSIDNTLDPGPGIVGGLVGFMLSNSLIINSSAAGPLVAGTDSVGGMVGESASGSQIVSSYAEFGEVNATHGEVGGLIGSTSDIDVKLSYAVTGKVAGQTVDSGAGRLGGLIGFAGGNGGSLSSSLAITANFTGIRLAPSGGLAGLSRASSNIFLAAIANNIDLPINVIPATGERGGGSGFIGNLLRSTTQIRSSYAVTNHASKGGFVASIANGVTVSSSYWDNTTLTPPDTTTLSANAVGNTTTNLQGTTDFTGIYEEWGNGWCDAATNEFTTDPSHPLAIDANRFWDLGTATEYPAMNCLPNFTPAEQRAAMAKALNGESPVRNLR